MINLEKFIYHVILKSRIDILKTLFESYKISDPDFKCHGKRILKIALENAEILIAKYLIDKGAEVNEEEIEQINGEGDIILSAYMIQKQIATLWSQLKLDDDQSKTFYQQTHNYPDRTILFFLKLLKKENLYEYFKNEVLGNNKKGGDLIKWQFKIEDKILKNHIEQISDSSKFVKKVKLLKRYLKHDKLIKFIDEIAQSWIIDKKKTTIQIINLLIEYNLSREKFHEIIEEIFQINPKNWKTTIVKELPKKTFISKKTCTREEILDDIFENYIEEEELSKNKILEILSQIDNAYEKPASFVKELKIKSNYTKNVFKFLKKSKKNTSGYSKRKFKEKRTAKVKSKINNNSTSIPSNNIGISDQKKEKPHLVLLNSKKISNYTKRDIIDWSYNYKKNKGYISPNSTTEIKLSEIFAILKRCTKLDSTKKYFPRDTQLISALLLTLAKSDKGCLLEVLTGEGKSTIITLFASYQLLMGKKVHVITTAADLAQRDAEEEKEFYEMLGFKIGTIERSLIFDHKKFDVIYGSIRQFQGLWLTFKNNKDLDIINPNYTAIVDEVDSLTIDQTSNFLRLSTDQPGMEHLNILLARIWLFINQSIDKLGKSTDVLLAIKNQAIKSTQEMIRPLSSEEEKEYQEYQNIQFEISKLYQNFNDKIKELENIENYETKNTNKEKLKKELNEEVDKRLNQSLWYKKGQPERISIPNYLRKFALSQVEIWVSNALESLLYYTEKREFDVIKDKIVPIDYKNTGEYQFSTNWQGGLSQFLEMAKKISLSKINLSPCYVSNGAFFELYGSKLYGLSGTLGSEENKTKLKKIYNLDIMVIPSFIKKEIDNNSHSIFRSKEFLPIICKTQKEWKKSILNDTLEKLNNGRSILMINKTAGNAEYFYYYLRKKYKYPQKIRLYTGKEASGCPFKTITPGQCLIATNISGRGTDIKITSEVDKNGGLHVLHTFLPSNLRNEKQTGGRTGRSKDNGTVGYILYNKELKRNINPYEAQHILQIMRNQRDEKEKKYLEDAEKNITKAKIKQKLFSKYCDIKNKLLGIDFKKNKKLRPFQSLAKKALEEKWGFWLVQNISGNKNIDENELNEKFDVFVEGLKRLIQTKYSYLEQLYDYKNKSKWEYFGKLNDNPYLFIIWGNKFVEASQYTNAILMYRQAIALDDDYSYLARYNLAYALLLKDRIGNQALALKELQKAKRRFENTYQFNISQTQQFIQIANKTQDITYQYRSQLDIMSAFAHYLDEAIQNLQKNIEEVKEAKNDGIIEKIQNNWNGKIVGTSSRVMDLDKIFHHSIDRIESNNTDKTNPLNTNLLSHSFHQQIILLQNRGCLGFFCLEGLKPVPWAKSTFLCAWAGTQIYAGYLITTCSLGAGARLGQVLIQDGIGDLLSVGQALYYRDLNLSNHFINKGISLTASAITFGAAATGDALGSTKFITKTVSKAVLAEGRKLFMQKASLALQKQALNFICSTILSKVIPWAIDQFYNEDSTVQIMLESINGDNVFFNATYLDTKNNNTFWEDRISKKGQMLAIEGYGTINLEKILNDGAKSAKDKIKKTFPMKSDNSQDEKTNSNHEKHWGDKLVDIFTKFGITLPKSLLKSWMRDSKGWFDSSKETTYEKTWYVASYSIDLLDILFQNFKNPPSINSYMTALEENAKNEYYILSNIQDQKIDDTIHSQKRNKLAKKLAKFYNRCRKQIITSTLERLSNIGINQLIDYGYENREKEFQQNFAKFQSARRTDLLHLNTIKFTERERKVISKEQSKLMDITEEKGMEDLENEIKFGRAQKDFFDVMAEKKKFHIVVKDKKGKVLFECGKKYKNSEQNKNLVIEYDSSILGHYKRIDNKSLEKFNLEDLKFDKSLPMFSNHNRSNKNQLLINQNGLKSSIYDIKSEDTILDNIINNNNNNYFKNSINYKSENRGNQYTKNLLSNFGSSKAISTQDIKKFGIEDTFKLSSNFIGDAYQNVLNLNQNIEIDPLTNNYKFKLNLKYGDLLQNDSRLSEVADQNIPSIIQKSNKLIDKNFLFLNNNKQTEDQDLFTKNLIHNYLTGSQNIEEQLQNSQNCGYKVIAEFLNEDPSKVKNQYLHHIHENIETYQVLSRDILYLRSIDHPSLYLGAGIPRFLMLKLTAAMETMVWGMDHPITQQTLKAVSYIIKAYVITAATVGGATAGSITGPTGAVCGGAKGALGALKAEKEAQIVAYIANESYEGLMCFLADTLGDQFDTFIVNATQFLDKDITNEDSLRFSKSLRALCYRGGNFAIQHYAQKGYQHMKNRGKIVKPPKEPGKKPKVINKSKAGQKHPKTGVEIDKNGFPKFEEKHKYKPKNSLEKNTVKLDKFTGNRDLDKKLAKQKAGFKETPKDYHWHHHQDCKTMELIHQDYHKMGHLGGHTINEYLNNVHNKIKYDSIKPIHISTVMNGIRNEDYPEFLKAKYLGQPERFFINQNIEQNENDNNKVNSIQNTFDINNIDISKAYNPYKGNKNDLIDFLTKKPQKSYQDYLNESFKKQFPELNIENSKNSSSDNKIKREKNSSTNENNKPRLSKNKILASSLALGAVGTGFVLHNNLNQDEEKIEIEDIQIDLDWIVVYQPGYNQQNGDSQVSIIFKEIFKKMDFKNFIIPQSRNIFDAENDITKYFLNDIEINSILNKIKNYNKIKPFHICLIGYSFGGNIVLENAKHIIEATKTNNIDISNIYFDIYTFSSPLLGLEKKHIDLMNYDKTTPILRYLLDKNQCKVNIEKNLEILNIPNLRINYAYCDINMPYHINKLNSVTKTLINGMISIHNKDLDIDKLSGALAESDGVVHTQNSNIGKYRETFGAIDFVDISEKYNISNCIHSKGTPLDKILNYIANPELIEFKIINIFKRHVNEGYNV